MGNCNKKGKPSRPSVRDPINIRGDKENKVSYAKVVLIGNSGVGKTSIAQRFIEGKFDENNKNTVGASYFQKNISFKDGSSLCLYIWDTAGGEKFQALAPLYYRVKSKYIINIFQNAHAAVVCYSVTDDDSLKQIDTWLNKLDEHGNIAKMIKVVVGNKSDVDKSERRVDLKEGKLFAQQRDLPFFETSALLNDGSIDELFQKLASQIKQSFTKEELHATV
ncbi:ras-related protein rabf1-like [Stylonychia lemnae]|uniref:Ras-related protein rabf1-like n=1 Tax=Stylonychia lemnae TaxID=5949 RepID=A0A078AI54_STYLE|nr:ras-related protein rabf1-like [Stylonychia lemnae]|eukprot:CDW81616.1 ras-related protein rabf1-like [Stylonychia lemnae]